MQLKEREVRYKGPGLTRLTRHKRQNRCPACPVSLVSPGPLLSHELRMNITPGYNVERLFKIGYELSLWLLAIIAFPKLFYDMIVYRKYKKSFLSRLAFGYPVIEKKEHLLIWIHAVSVGETKAVVSLARRLKANCPSVKIVISSTTETGHAEAKRSISFADWHVYLPFDFSRIVRKIVKQAKPDLVILSETDLWYNFLDAAKAEGASIAIVNGKVSLRSLNRLEKAFFFTKRLYGLIDLLCVQNHLYKERFLQLGVPSDKLVVTGNIKFDDDYPTLQADEIVVWKNRLGITAKQPVLTIGSTHHPEEKILLEILSHVWKEVPDLKVLLVPRHPERFKEVALLLERQGIPFVKFSEISERNGTEKVVLVDAMGLLRMCYQLADIAVVCGSFVTRIGGHNILEPSWYGIPVIFGPYMDTQAELVDLVKEYQAGWQLEASHILKKLMYLIKNNEARLKIGQNGLRLIADLKGGTQRTMSALEILLKPLCEKYTEKV